MVLSLYLDNYKNDFTCFACNKYYQLPEDPPDQESSNEVTSKSTQVEEISEVQPVSENAPNKLTLLSSLRCEDTYESLDDGAETAPGRGNDPENVTKKVTDKATETKTPVNVSVAVQTEITGDVIGTNSRISNPEKENGNSKPTNQNPPESQLKPSGPESHKSVEEIDVTDSQRNRYQKIAKELYKEYGKYFGDSNDGNSSRYGLHPSQSAIGLAYAKIVKS